MVCILLPQKAEQLVIYHVQAPVPVKGLVLGVVNPAVLSLL